MSGLLRNITNRNHGDGFPSADLAIVERSTVENVGDRRAIVCHGVSAIRCASSPVFQYFNIHPTGFWPVDSYKEKDVTPRTMPHRNESPEKMTPKRPAPGISFAKRKFAQRTFQSKRGAHANGFFDRCDVATLTKLDRSADARETLETCSALHL